MGLAPLAWGWETVEEELGAAGWAGEGVGSEPQASKKKSIEVIAGNRLRWKIVGGGVDTLQL